MKLIFFFHMINFLVFVQMLQECGGLSSTVTNADVHRTLRMFINTYQDDEEVLAFLFSYILQFVLQSEQHSLTELLGVVRKYEDHSHFIIRQVGYGSFPLTYCILPISFIVFSKYQFGRSAA